MFQYNADNGIKTNLSREIIFLVTLINFNVTRRTSAKQKSQCKNASSLVGITMHTNLPTDTMHSSLKKNHQWNVKPVEESLARVPTKRIAPARYSRSRVVLAFFCKSMSNRQTARHRSSRFFKTLFTARSRLSRAVCLRAGDRGKITRGTRDDKVQDRDDRGDPQLPATLQDT